MSKKQKQKLDKFHYHEAYDRVYLIMCVLENQIIQHRVIQSKKKYRKQLQYVVEKLFDIYHQLILDAVKLSGKDLTEDDIEAIDDAYLCGVVSERLKKLDSAIEVGFSTRSSKGLREDLLDASNKKDNQ